MRIRLPLAILVASAVVGALPAAAKCTRLGFSVNDYGKDGPTKDAKALLDTYIAKWAAEHNIAKYTVGKKDVKCDLFLDLIVFDEHTCRAEASVCWTEAPGQKPFTPDGTAAAAPAAKPAKSDKPEKAVKPAKAAPKSAAAPVSSPIETGTLPPGVKLLSPPTATPAAVPAAPSAADQAASAAEKAAAAAERAASAAAAAENAAAAAKASTAAAPVQPAAAPAAAPAAKE